MSDWDRVFTPKEKYKMVKDWLGLFPSLKKYRAMSIGNRVGPLLVGIHLETIRGRLLRPAYSVHNLCGGHPAIILTFKKEYQFITPYTYEEEYHKAAESLVKQGFAIPLEGDLTIDEIIAVYENFFYEEKLVRTLAERMDLPMICGWTNEKDKVEYALKLVYDDLVKREQMKRWFREPGSFEKWFHEVEEKAWNYEERRAVYEQELITHRLQKLPERKLIY